MLHTSIQRDANAKNTSAKSLKLNTARITKPVHRLGLHQRESTMEIMDMNEVVERLKASKEKHETMEYERGQKAGHLWACAQADFVDLEAISDLVLPPFNVGGPSYAALVDDALGNDWRNGESLWMNDEGDKVEHPSDEYVLGLVQSAAKVFAEVEGRL
jgi:hypothetical protein